MNKYIAREFVCMVAKKLDLPSFIYEEMENKLINGKAEEVIEFIVNKSKEPQIENAKRILQGLESYGNNGINQGKLTTSQIRLFFKEHYGIELN